MEVSRLPQARNIVRIDNSLLKATLNGESEEIYLSSAYGYIDNIYSNITNTTSLPSNTIGVSSKVINSMLGVDLSDAEINALNGKTITLSKYRAHQVGGEEPLFTKDFRIQVYRTLSFDFIFSEDVFTFLRGFDMIPYSYIFTNLEEVSNVYYALEEVPFIPNSLYIDAGIEINRVVVVFNDFFLLISVILLLSILLILGSNAFNNVNQRKNEIGIFKALGMRNSDITMIFVLQILFSTILTIILFSIGIAIFTNVTNNILFNSFMTYLKNPALKMIDILTFNFGAFSLDLLSLMLINGLTTLIPFINLRRLKPLNILRKSR
jgi:ABC-type antimicrobial peptide transport system permease subunit